jgi:hypothetical protein
MRNTIVSMAWVATLFVMGCTHIVGDREMASVEFLYIPDCPNSPDMRASLKAAIASSGQKIRVVEVDLMFLKPGDVRLGFGAPSVLVDGVDLFGAKPAKALSGSCRVYPGDLPSSKDIRARLSSVLSP